ncbi:MAG TPA: hypothetical protein VHO24_15460 [Opitutaceae bacterium]|nr:hypothetical protein [Opitutaceae bacterium]
MAKAHPAPRTLSDFKSETLRGTAGFVRVGQTRAGQWWFIDAHDRPFFSRGVAAVNRFGRAGGRGTQPGAYERAVDRIHGANDPQSFVTAATKRLRAWHCNTLAAWTAPEFFDRGFFYTETIGFRQAVPEAMIKLGGALLPDVFDPRWVAGCDLLAAAICPLRRERPDLIGYFTDHGLQWAQPRTGPDAPRKQRPSLLQICLSLEPSFPAYHAAWEFALAPHAGELATLAAAWGIEPNKQALRQLTLADTPLLSAAYLGDHERFTREFARRYVEVCAAAVRRHDPDHLVLGCPFDAPPGAAVLGAFAAPAVDVLSLHCATETVFETIDDFARLNAMPVLLAEFSWTGKAFTKKQTQERRQLTSVERMLSSARAALTRACTHPALVGYVWSRWADAPDDTPPFGQGLVHLDDHEAREHTELLTEINTHAEAVRRGAV